MATELAEGHRLQLDGIVQRMIANQEPEENIRWVVSDFKQKYAQPAAPSQSLGQYAVGLAESVPQTAIGLGREAVRFGQDIASFPSRLGQAGQIDWQDLLRNPRPIGTAAVETGKQLVEPLAQALPEISGATIGTLLGGPGGGPLGAGMMRELVGLLEGQPARARGQAAGSAMLSTAIGQRAPQAIEFAKKAPARYLSLPAERHAAGAAMMEKIPERFGVDDALVSQRYHAAENLSRMAGKIRSEVQISEKAGGPILDHVRGFNEAVAEASKLSEQVDILQRAGQPVPRQLQTALDSAKEQANPKNSTVMRWLTTSPLESFRGTINGLVSELKSNPIPELQNKALIGKLNTVSKEAQQVFSRGGATAEGVNRIIQSVNAEIGETTGAVRGTWKQILRSLHEDMKAAAETTGNPAFQTYSEAIHTARLNFLRQDLQQVIESSGIRNQRTGVSVITNPGAVKQWMQKNPDWVKNVEKTQPGIIDAIRKDLQEIIPITDVAGRGIPGQQYGSGRFALGAGTGVILSKILGLDPWTTSAAMSLISGLSGKVGLEFGPAAIQRGFRPSATPPSVAGATTGAILSPGLGAESGVP